MTRLACLLVVAAACQRGASGSGSGSGGPGSGSGAQPTTQAYRDDIAALCDVLRLSGADQQEPSARAALIAMWLGPHLKTPESHDFLVKIQPLVGTATADALDGEAKRLGMPGCALAAEWRK